MPQKSKLKIIHSILELEPVKKSKQDLPKESARIEKQEKNKTIAVKKIVWKVVKITTCDGKHFPTDEIFLVSYPAKKGIAKRKKNR